MTLHRLTSRTQSILQRCNGLLARNVTSRARACEPTLFERTELSRHDHHNLEIKMLTQPGNRWIESELEVFLFVPGSFQLSRWGKTELQNDFRSRLRLAIPLQADEGHAAITDAARLLRETLQSLSHEETISESSESPIFFQLAERAKEVGSVVGETLKQLGKQHRNRFLLAHSLAGDLVGCLTALGELQSALEQSAEMVRSIRDTLAEAAPQAHLQCQAAPQAHLQCQAAPQAHLQCADTAPHISQAPSAPPQNPILALLDEFISHLYVQYLGSLRGAMNQLSPVPSRFDVPAYAAARGRLNQRLTELQKCEAVYRRRFAQGLERAKNTADQEHQLVRLSQLKKFFQSRMFVEVSRRDPNRRITESTAALGAACASLWAAFAKQFERNDLFQTSYKGLAVLSIGVIAYVMKDRVKEWTKRGFLRRASRLFPDFSQHLMAEGRAIGGIREWFQFRKAKALPKKIRELRLRACRSEIENGLPEDVFHYRRKQTFQPLQPRSLAIQAPAAPACWAIQENLRINVERYLKHMADPFKELAVLDSTGQLSQFRSHRVYDFYVGIRTAHRSMPDDFFLSPRPFFSPPASPSQPAGETARLYRVILDKKGIDRVEEIGCT